MAEKSLMRALRIIPAAAIGVRPVGDSIVLDYEDRHTRREVRTTEGGTRFLIDLARVTLLREGDALELEDGALVRVKSAPEELLKIEAGDGEALNRAAWHIGNRHTPLEVAKNALYISADHVLAEMLKAHGCRVTSVRRPFNPERGAYDAPQGEHAHGHSHEHHHHEH